MLLTTTRLAAFATALTMLIPAAWAGDECASDTDCPDGQVCNFYNSVDCPELPPCDGEDCPEPSDCGESQSSGECGFANGSECAADSDCPDGFTCDIVGGWASAGSACVCPDSEPDCDCPDATEPSSGDIYGCVPAPCESDSDCADDMVCIQIKADCDDAPVVIGAPEPAAPPCEEGEDCGGKDEPSGSSGSGGSSGSDGAGSSEEDAAKDEQEDECDEDEIIASYCAPKWAAPCETASDCGDGFTCDPVEICECSGGGSTGSAGSSSGGATPGSAPTPTDSDSDPDSDSSSSSSDGGTDDDGGGDDEGPGDREDGDDESWEDSCDCYPGDENQCVIIEVECSTADDCPSGWECVAGPSMAVPCSFDEESGEEDCPEPEAAPSVCQPEGYWGGGADFGWDHAADAEAGGGGAATSGPAGDPNSGQDGGEGGDSAPTSPGDDSGSDGSTAGGEAGAGDADGGDSAGGDNNAAAGGDSTSGCAGGNAPSTGLLTLMALGLAMALRRRTGLRHHA